MTKTKWEKQIQQLDKWETGTLLIFSLQHAPAEFVFIKCTTEHKHVGVTSDTPTQTLKPHPACPMLPEPAVCSTPSILTSLGHEVSPEEYKHTHTHPPMTRVRILFCARQAAEPWSCVSVSPPCLDNTKASRYGCQLKTDGLSENWQGSN